MKLILISDTHEQHDRVEIPECDVLVHAGDFTYTGGYSEIQTAFHWLDKQPAKYVVAIAGNHDYLFERYPEAGREIVAQTRVHYLENSSVVLGDVKFWGSPYTPRFFDWAFNCDRADINKHWDLIPNDTDVLITHGPSMGTLDQAAPHFASKHLGCYDLREAIKRVRPKVHVFGHIHGGTYFGQHIFRDGTDHYNASVVNEAYKVVNKPIIHKLDTVL